MLSSKCRGPSAAHGDGARAAVGTGSVFSLLADATRIRIVRARQQGNRVFYSLVDEHARTLVTQAVFQAQHAVDEQPAHHGAHPDGNPS